MFNAKSHHTLQHRRLAVRPAHYTVSQACQNTTRNHIVAAAAAGRLCSQFVSPGECLHFEMMNFALKMQVPYELLLCRPRMGSKFISFNAK